jgi:hypothetical protein
MAQFGTIRRLLLQLSSIFPASCNFHQSFHGTLDASETIKGNLKNEFIKIMFFLVLGTLVATDCFGFVHFLSLFDYPSFAIQCHNPIGTVHPSQTRVGLCPWHHTL